MLFPNCLVTKQRQLKVQSEEPKQSKLRRPPRSQAWSKQKERKDRKKKRKEVKEISRKRKAQDAEAADEEEEDDFQDDVKLMKKLKRGKVYINVYYIFEKRCVSTPRVLLVNVRLK